MGQKYLGKIDHPKSYINKEYVDALIAPSEYDVTSSSNAYNVGDYFICNKILYQATSQITVGGAITPNSNCIVIGDLSTLVEDREKYLSVTFGTSDFMVNGDNRIPANYVGSKLISELNVAFNYYAQLSTDPGSVDLVRLAKFKSFNGVQAGILYVYCDAVPTDSVTFNGTFTQV